MTDLSQELSIATRIIRTPFEMPSSAPSAFFGPENVYESVKAKQAVLHFYDVACSVSDNAHRLLGVASGYSERRDGRRIYGEWWTTVSFDAALPRPSRSPTEADIGGTA